MAGRVTRVAIIDDHNVVRLGIKAVLQLSDELELAGELGSGEGAVEFLGECGADVVLLDVRMPGIDGIEVLKAVRKAKLPVKVVMLTTSDTEADVAASVKAGANGYVLKDLEPEKLVEAIRTVAGGGEYFPGEIAALYEQSKSSPGLSAREREILEYVSKGLSNTDISEMLGLSSETVKMHMKHVFAKLQVEDRVEAVTMAISRGILKV